MSLRPSDLTVLFVICATLAGIAGCAFLERRAPVADQVVKAVEKVDQAVEPSIAVLQCASFVQRLAFDSGKRLSTGAALAFCTALEASPDVNPQPAAPVASTIDA